MSGVKLYSAAICPFAQRSRIILAEKDIPYDTIEIDLSNKPADFLALNPLGKVPVLVHTLSADAKPVVVYESSIIAEYVEEAFSNVEPRLMPDSPADRAHARILIAHINERVIPAMYQIMFTRQESEAFAGKVTAFESGLEFLEKELEKTGAAFFGGEKYNIVDVSLIPFFERAITLKEIRGYSIPFADKFPRLGEWERRMRQTKGFKLTESDPEHIVTVYRAYAEKNTK